MKVNITSLQAINCMSFANVHISSEAYKPGLYLVRGENLDDVVDGERKNGAGKSVFAMELLALGLFGRTFRGTSEVRRWYPEAQFAPTSISVRFAVRDRHYVAVRTFAIQQRLKLYDATTDEETHLTLRTLADTQAELESILGMDWAAFCASFAFGQSAAFKFSSLASSERRKVIEGAVGVDTYRRAAGKAREKAKTLRLKKQGLEGKLKEATNLLKLREDGLKDARAELKRQQVKQLEAYSKLEEHRSVKAPLFPRPDGLRLDELRKKFEDIGARKALVSGRIRSLKERLAEAKQSAVCPTCGQLIETQKAMNSANEIQRKLKKRLNVLDDKAEYLLGRYLELREKLDVVQAKHQRREKAWNEFDYAMETARNLEVWLIDIHPISHYEKSVANFERLLAEDQQRLADALAALEQVDKNLDGYEYLVKAMGDEGMATAVVEHAVPILNQKADEVADELGNAERPVFSATKEGKKKTLNQVSLFVDKDGELHPYESFSSGEDVGVDLAVGSAIQSLNAGKSELNVAVFDEVLDHLDKVGAARVISYLRKLAEKKAVWLITHADWVLDATEWKDVFCIQKKGGVSKLVESGR